MKKLSLILFLSILSHFAWATNYYISNEGLTGNTGQAPGSSWPLSKFNGNNFITGDSVKFLKGEIFSGTNIFISSGSSGSPIVIDVYGNAVNNAWLDGGASTSAATLKITTNYVTVNNLVIQNSQYQFGICFLSPGTVGITFNNCYVNTGILGIDAFQCGAAGVANIKVLHCWFTNITDVDNGSGHFLYGSGNHVQFNNCNGSGMEIAYNNCYTPITIGLSLTQFVGDIISVFQCNGTSGSLILVHDNNVRGGGSSTPATFGGKAGIVLGDVGGSYQYAYNNVVVNGGASGMLVQGGTNITMSNNKIYGAQQPYTTIGLGYGNYSDVPANSNTMANNLINWTYHSGGVQNLFIDQGTTAKSTATGLPGGATLALPTGWASNTANSVADPGAFDALLTNPLWTGSPWNTNSTLITIKGRHVAFN